MSLYPYQDEGVAFLRAHPRAYLADEMGLGKTVQAVVAARTLAYTKAPRCIVVCPASVQEHWKREWKTWYGPSKPIVISYAKLIRSDLHQIFPVPDLVILDEAHYCKTPSAKRSKAALKLAQRAERAWLLSGTPVPNDPRELWAPIKYLWPELAKSFGISNAFEWMDRWCRWTTSDYGYRVWGLTPAAKTELVPALRGIILRRKLEDVALELPPLRFTVEMLPQDPLLAKKLLDMGVDMENEEHMSTLRRVLGRYKARPISLRIVEELAAKQYGAIVVLYHHHDTGAALSHTFSMAGYKLLGFDGRTALGDRTQAIDRFQAGHARIFLAQQTAAGVGITLTRASEIVLVEPSWSPEDNTQAIKRIHRIGQDRPCRARLFAVPGSLDDNLMATIRRKSQMIGTLLEETHG